MKSVEIGTILRQTLPLFLTVGIVEMGANALFFSESLIFMQGPADIKFSNNFRN